MELFLSPDYPYFRIKTTSTRVSSLISMLKFVFYFEKFQGESVVDISKHSEMVLIFQCSTTTTSYYAYSNIKQILKVLSYANKVSIATGDSGLLYLQLFITTNEKQMYVEYFVTAMFDDTIS